jgi:hypothetical protein
MKAFASLLCCCVAGRLHRGRAPAIARADSTSKRQVAPRFSTGMRRTSSRYPGPGRLLPTDSAFGGPSERANYAAAFVLS